jgi:hypothetical protein
VAATEFVRQSVRQTIALQQATRLSTRWVPAGKNSPAELTRANDWKKLADIMQRQKCHRSAPRKRPNSSSARSHLLSSRHSCLGGVNIKSILSTTSSDLLKHHTSNVGQASSKLASIVGDIAVYSANVWFPASSTEYRGPLSDRNRRPAKRGRQFLSCLNMLCVYTNE